MIKTELVSCRSRKASRSLESRMRDQHWDRWRPPSRGLQTRWLRPLSGIRLRFEREHSCSGQCESGLHDSKQRTRAQATEDDIRLAE
jgi:hypothetical protein